MKKVLFRCDSSSTIGLGHVKRCLVLANRLRNKRKNLEIVFSTLDLCGNINNEVSKNGFKIFNLRNNDIENLDFVIKNLNIDFLIIDSYDINDSFEEQLKIRNPKLKILSFDDMIKQHKSDIIINHGIQAEKSLYKDLVQKNCKLFCGSKYTILRDEFFKKYKSKIKKNSVAIILGGNDILNLSLKIANLLFEINNKYKITIITTSVNPNLEKLNQNKNIELLIDISNIAEVLSSKELIICSSSGVLFEVMALKKKFINIQVAENQKVVSEFLEKKKVKTTIKAKDLTKEVLRSKIEYVKRSNSYKKLALKFAKNKLAKKILKELK